MSKKISIIVISLIIFVSLIISICLPNKEEAEDTSINYITFERNGKIGVVEGNNIIIEPQYEEIIITNPHRAVFWCKIGEDEKFVNKENEEIFQKYSNVELIEIIDEKYEKNILKYEKDGKFGLLKITGKPITEAKYEEISSLGYKETEVLVKENGKYGILDENGNTKIKNKYDKILSDEYYTEENKYKKSGYIVQNTTIDGYRYGYYDYEGVQVLSEEYNQINRLTQIESNDIYLIASKNGQYGVFVNNSKIINTQYQMIDYNTDLEIFIVERTGKYGAINLKGVEILKPEYDELQINGIYMYTVKGEERKVWDTSGKEVDIAYDTVIQKTNSEYLIKNEAGNYSILNNKLEPISTQSYKYLEFAFDKYFIATNNEDKTGIIDLQENVKIYYNYDIIQVIKGTSAIQAINFENNTTTVFDKDLNIVTELFEANIEYLENGFRVYNNEMELYLDANGKLINR